MLAATTASLVKRIEKQVNKLRQDYFTANPTATGVEDPSLVPLRVTLVYNDDPTMYDIAKVLTTPDVTRPETMLTFNGATAISDTNMNNYHEVKVEAANYHTMPLMHLPQPKRCARTSLFVVVCAVRPAIQIV